MADSKLPEKAQTTLKAPPIPNIEAPFENERVWQYKQRIIQAQNNKGSRYPPFSIEPMTWERMRVAQPMTEADRFLRKQWWQDQKIGHGERVYVPEAEFKCTMRQIWSYPMDKMAVGVAKVAGTRAGMMYRMVVPKILAAYVLGLAGFYYVKYSPRTWEGCYGLSVYCSRRATIAGSSSIASEPSFADLSFGDRNIKSLPTSAQQ